MPSATLFALVALVGSVLAVPTPPLAYAKAYGPIWKRDIEARFEAEPRGFTDSKGVRHVPLFRRTSDLGAASKSSGSQRRRIIARDGGAILQQGLGDYEDLEYTVAMNVGGSEMWFQLDTGSSDLWGAMTACTTTDCKEGVSNGAPRYAGDKDSSFKSTGLDFAIQYGDSAKSTFANGTVGTTNIEFAGQSFQDATFSAVDSTNNGIVHTTAGIFGVSFPMISDAARGIFNASFASNSTLAAASAADQAAAFFQTLSSSGGLMTRMATTPGTLDSPSFSLSLQRLLDPTYSNAGVLTIGGLPSGVSADQMTYVDVSTYPGSHWMRFPFVSEIPSVNALWEAKYDKVVVNGKTLGGSTIYDTSSFGTYALIDSGTSAVVGPQDLVEEIYQLLNLDPGSRQVPCDTELNFSVFFGGKEFAVDPLDWLSPGQGNTCKLMLEPGTLPSSDTSYTSWILGDVFMKNVLTHFSYGPSFQPPTAQIGFLSTTSPSLSSTRFTSLLPSSLSGAFPTGATPYYSLGTVAAPTGTTSVANPVSAGAGVGNAATTVAATPGVQDKKSGAAGGVSASVVAWVVSGIVAVVFA